MSGNMVPEIVKTEYDIMRGKTFTVKDAISFLPNKPKYNSYAYYLERILVKIKYRAMKNKRFIEIIEPGMLIRLWYGLSFDTFYINTLENEFKNRGFNTTKIAYSHNSYGLRISW